MRQSSATGNSRPGKWSRVVDVCAASLYSINYSQSRTLNFCVFSSRDCGENLVLRTHKPKDTTPSYFAGWIRSERMLAPQQHKYTPEKV